MSPRPIDPYGMEPAGIEPAGIDPAGIEPAGMEPAGIEPAGIEPAGMEPAGIEPAGIEPAGRADVVPPRNGIRDAGIAPTGSDARPAAIERSSTSRVSALMARALTVIVTSCSARTEPSATALTVNWWVPVGVPSGTVTVSS